MLRIVVGRMAQVLTSSQRCDPTVAKRTGYVYQHPQLEEALRSVLS
jgi:NAD dependent epimerase/dehydratase family enzyme